VSAADDVRQAKAAAKSVIDALQNRNLHPMEAMAAASFALGAMVAAAAENGISKPGRSGQLLAHLFQLAESAAEEALEQNA
jgi:hypothetical protein